MDGMAIKNNKNRERDQFTVVLEAIQSDFHVFGEKLEFIDAHLDRIDVRLDRIEERTDAIEMRLDKIELHLDKIESELVGIKLEISELKTKLDKKADIGRLEKLEERVKCIETVLTKEKRG
jgi:chromosome segregation ATPase